jgi:1-deoxy-D-xylulose 5-phosphate reductoisomerase
VAAFVAGKIGFLDIPRVVEQVLNNDWQTKGTGLTAVLAADTYSRSLAESAILTIME